MPYYFSTASQQNTNSSANTDLLLAQWWTTATTGRAFIQKAVFGSYATPADNAIRLRITRATTATTIVAGSSITPVGYQAELTSPTVINAQTLPTFTGSITDVPLVQVAFNQRGTAMWAAFVPDEGIGITGAGTSTTKSTANVFLMSQSTGTSVPVNFDVLSSE